MALLGTIIGLGGYGRLPRKERSKLLSNGSMLSLVPDEKDSPLGFHTPSPPLRNDWVSRVSKSGETTLRDLYDLNTPAGELLALTYPQLLGTRVRFRTTLKESGDRHHSYLPRRSDRAGTGLVYIDERVADIQGMDGGQDYLAGILAHEALTHGVAESENWPEKFRGSSPERTGSVAVYLDQPGERLARAHEALTRLYGGGDAPATLPELSTRSGSKNPYGLLLRRETERTPVFDAKGGHVAKGGDAPDLTGMSNFLATDKVPDTLFGIPVVSRREDYTEVDLRFFKDHPEAGGYYDMGEETPEDGSTEGAPVQADGGGATRSAYPGAWNNPGNVRPGSVKYVGQNGTKIGKSGGAFLTFDTPQNGLNAMADVIGQIASVKIPRQFNEERLADDRFTVRTLLEVYAPETDKNDVNDYTKFVSNRLGVGPSDELRLNDTATMMKLLDAMVRRDSGHEHANWFTLEEYRTAAERMKGTRK